MSTNYFKPAAMAIAITAALLPGSQAFAAEFWLRAKALTVQMPNPDGTNVTVAVPMWGYANCANALPSSCGLPTVPGPALTVPAGDTTLTVHLANDLAVPTSLVVNGLIKPMVPVWNDASLGPRTSATARVRSFDAEAAAGGIAAYTWPNVKPGTYLYQSGTQPQVQVQMGLYGAVSKNAVEAVSLPTTPVRAQSYPGATYEYDNQAILLYSEIDPVMHASIADGSYGTLPAPTSTFNYAPKYFLINGQPYPVNPVVLPLGAPGTTLLRFLNAGLMTHVPTIQGTHWNVVAEDGKPYSHSQNQYTAFLAAAKTMDVLLTPSADAIGGASYAIIDRRLSLSNNGLSDGGMLAFLSYGSQGVAGATGLTDGNIAPIATPDTYNVVKGVTLNVPSPGVLANDNNTDGLPLPIRAVAASGLTADGGTYTLSTNGSFSYKPKVGSTAVTDTFTYVATDGKALTDPPTTVTFNISVPSEPTTLGLVDDFDRPLATSLGTSTVGGIATGPAWSQQVNTVSSQPDLGESGTSVIANTTTLGGLAVLNQVYTETQGASYNSATPLLKAALILKATGGTLPSSPGNYVRVRCEATNGGELVVATMMGGSNVSVFVRQAAFADAACMGTGSLSAMVDAQGLVTTFVNGTFVGGVQLPDVAAWKGTGKVGIQLQSAGGTVDNFRAGSL